MNEKRTYKKLIIFLFWMLILGVAIFGYFYFDVPLSEYPELIQSFVERFGIWAPIIFILLYTIRPLIFFPGTILTISAGALFGPWYGMAYILIGANLSAALSFYVGRYFGKDFMKHMSGSNKILSLMDCRFRDNGFMVTLIMRLVFMPFDLVSYAAGVCDLRYRDFAWATFIGIIPGSFTFVLLGSSFADPKNLLLSALFFVVGLLISRYLKKKNLLKPVQHNS